jgi:sialidase-1
MKNRSVLIMLFISMSVLSFLTKCQPDSSAFSEVRKVKDIIIYEDPQFYSSFPSVVKNVENDFMSPV